MGSLGCLWFGFKDLLVLRTLWWACSVQPTGLVAILAKCLGLGLGV